MSLLQDHSWQVKYTPDDGDLVRRLYVPALCCAVRYDRLTGFFSARALVLAARGVEGLVANRGNMRLVVGCTLEPPEIAAIAEGEKLRAAVERHLRASPLDATKPETVDALQLLAWMVAEGHLEVKVAVPCDTQRRPVASSAIFHEKAGIIEDKTGERIAFNGSLNETAAGWTQNWESLNVFTSWEEPKRVAQEEANFAKIWANQAKHVITLDVPTAVRDDLLRFIPDGHPPSRTRTSPPVPTDAELPQPSQPLLPPAGDLRRLVWGFVDHAPNMPVGGERVGEATCAVTPWPHQVRAFERMYRLWPTRLLIADEVGLGKTIQAGMLIRQAWLSGRAKRILIMVPSNVRPQWQIEMREKFNLNIPIYDGQRLHWLPTPAMRHCAERVVDREAWHKEPIVIASSHLMRRSERQPELLEKADPWDLVVLDEAHHARRRGAGTMTEGGPNTLLRLMLGLRQRTQGLLLLTATPMQVHPVEVWDLLNLLGLPSEWSPTSFVRFFEEIEADNPSHTSFDWLSTMFRASEAAFGALNLDDIQRYDPQRSKMRAKKVLTALRDPSGIPRRQLETAERNLALRAVRASSPVARLVSRHTRDLLRRYHKAGMLTTRIADRAVADRFVEMTPAERALYEAVESYISTTYARAGEKEKTAVGFVLTIYRKRLASSFHALRRTLEGHLASITSVTKGVLPGLLAEDDLPDDEGEEEAPDVDEAMELQRQALALEEKADIASLLERIRALPPDTKLVRLRDALAELRDAGYSQAMVFTQYTDTMEFLRGQLAGKEGLRIMCFSGRGGEVAEADGSWRVVSRDDVKRRFREGRADLLLCTDAASEGLNFQFCGALINYDMPWNPMRVEQRIGRIDRLGQRFENVRIVNLHYAETVETDVYIALRERIGLFQSVVGRLQPILSQLPRLIANSVLRGGGADDRQRQSIAHAVAAQADDPRAGGFDLDAVTEADLVEPVRPQPPLDMADLDLILKQPALLPPGVLVKPTGSRQYALTAPGLPNAVWVSTDPSFVEEHPDNVELWSPGNPIFCRSESIAAAEELPRGTSISQLIGVPKDEAA